MPEGDAAMGLDLIRLAALIETRDRHALNQGFTRLIQTHFSAESVTLAQVVGEESEQRWLVSASSVEGFEDDLDDPAWRDWRDLPTLEGVPAWTSCYQDASRSVHRPEPGVCLFPCVLDSSVIGVVEVRSQDDLGEAGQREVSNLLSVFRSLHALLDYSQRDSLTGLLNRKSFDESFYKASALPVPKSAANLPERRNLPVIQYWLGVIDIDHFKLVNDRFGHLIGDEVLLLLARVMRNCLRQVDRLYRFGGEEFVVLLRCAGEETAQTALERLAESVRECRFPRVEKITISVGFTDVRIGDTPSASVERADQSVYIAKASGRDRVISYAAMLRDGRLQETSSVGDIELFG
jgi:diguanylate cyclase (GGDEF)-like protein